MYVTTHLLRFFGSLEAPPDEESDGIRGTPSVLSRFGSMLRLPLYADGRFRIPMTHVADAGTPTIKGATGSVFIM